MDELRGFQRRYLRGLANPIKPNVFIGKNGITDELLEAINQDLDNHELIKVRFQDFKEQRKELSAELAEKTNAHLAGVIGHVAILYRQNPDPEKRRITLPQKSEN